MLLCPKCAQKLYKKENRYCCEQGHSYDIAKRGYVHLLLNAPKLSGDDKEMVKARSAFLEKGYYRPFRDALSKLIRSLQPKVMIDAGCGEGYYTNAFQKVLDQTQIYGFDISKWAIDEACKAKSGVHYCVCSSFHMPLSDACADVVLSVFSPFDSKEIARVLKPGGFFIKAGPGSRHLYDLKKVLYETPYENEEEHRLEMLHFCRQETLSYSMQVSSGADLQALFHMTPYYWRTPKQGRKRLEQLNELAIEAQFLIQIYQKL